MEEEKGFNQETLKYLQNGIERGQRLNFFQMLKDIDKLVTTEFCEEMELKTLPKSRKYTQAEAKQMADIIGSVYSIAHCIHCYACQAKYLTK